MSHKIFAISIIQKLTTAKFCRRKTQPRRQLRWQKLNAVVNSEGCTPIIINPLPLVIIYKLSIISAPFTVSDILAPSTVDNISAPSAID